MENRYQQIMEQVEHPEGVKSHHTVVCTRERVEAKTGQLYPDNKAWRIIEMKYLGPYNKQVFDQQ